MEGIVMDKNSEISEDIKNTDNTETNEEQTTQRIDDYDGLSRRIDDVLNAVNTVLKRVDVIADAVKISDAVAPDTVVIDPDDSDDIDLDTPLENLDFDVR